MFSRILLVVFVISNIVICSSRTLAPSPDNSEVEDYIVFVDRALYHDDCKKYQQLLQDILHGRSSKEAPICCYKHVMSGFAARLTEDEAEILRGERGILSVTKDEIYSIND